MLPRSDLRESFFFVSTDVTPTTSSVHTSRPERKFGAMGIAKRLKTAPDKIQQEFLADILVRFRKSCKILRLLGSYQTKTKKAGRIGAKRTESTNVTSSVTQCSTLGVTLYPRSLRS